MQASLRAATPEDASFLFQLQCATMKAYVVQTWGEWDETWQSRYFRERFDPASTQIVVVQGQDAGVLWVERCPTEFFLRSIAILPAFQRHGIGTWLIQSLIAEAHGQGLPVMLRVLKVNPARRLYERLGFHITGETDSHYLMSTRQVTQDGA